MKSTLVLLALLPFAIEATRAKRFAALASGIGGAAGCVVTGNTLYANGFALRNLSSSEMNELSQYETAMKQYKQQLKAALKTQRDRMKQQLMSSMGGGQDGGNSVTQSTTDDAANLEAPTRPSFCNESTTTQYYFDGCMVQNNKVYVGKTFARDLTSDEIKQLQDFDVQMTAYQKQVQENIHKQMKGMFGGSDFFSALFGGNVNDDQSATTTQSQQQQDTTTVAQQQEKLEAPEAPQFCYSI